MLQLKPMTERDFQGFFDWAMEDYAQEQIKAGAWQETNAKDLAKKVFDGLLPEGLSTPNQFLCMIQREADGENVGQLWWGIQSSGKSRIATLNDIVIFYEHRRRGYGTEALLALEMFVRQEGMDSIFLHVFGHNKAARALYQKMGYVERNVTMMKKLEEATL